MGNTFFNNLEKIAKENIQRIVFPEGTDERILSAAIRLKENAVLEPIVIGDESEIKALAEKLGKNANGIQILNPKTYGEIDFLVEKFTERRKGKIDEEGARKLLLEDENYFGTLLVFTGKADGLVSGAAHSTGDTVRPALQIIKTKPKYSLVSGAFLMLRDDELYIFADCAINLNPDSEGLAQIAAQASETGKKYGLDSKVALLSFSTKGSAQGEMVEKVQKAYEISKEKYPEMVVDGELQFDAAFVPEVAKKKLSSSPVAGQANVFVFPDLQAGNIGYKMVQRLAGFEAIGPILQGLNSPVNDLSRGCNEEDVYKLSIISAVEAIKDKEQK